MVRLRRNAWAFPALLGRDPRLKGLKIGFEHLQAAVNVQHWNPHHRMASHAVHPSATFLRFSLGGRENIPVILAGPSNVDFADPGQGALFSLINATAALLIHEPAADPEHFSQLLSHRLSLAGMTLALHALSEVACQEFIKVHEQLEKEIRQEFDLAEEGD